MGEEDERRKEEQQKKIMEEREQRHKQKDDMEKREEEELKALEKTSRKRNDKVEAIEKRTIENEEFELAQIRLRWKASDAKKAAEKKALGRKGEVPRRCENQKRGGRKQEEGSTKE